MAIEIRLYVLQDNGELEPGDNMPLGEFGECPSVGDVLCLGFEATAFSFYSVVSRYFLRTDNGHGWALIVRDNPASDVNDKVLKAWLEDDAFWAEADREDEAKQEKKLREALMLSTKDKRRNSPPPISPDLDWREHRTMEYLVGLGAEVRTPWHTLKHFGPSTQKKLEGRRYIRVSYETGKSNVLNEVWLTKAGMKAWRDLRRYYEEYPSL